MADRRARLVAASSGDAEHAARVEAILPPSVEDGGVGFPREPLEPELAVVAWRARAHAEYELRLAAERRLERARARHGRETAVIFVLVLFGLWAVLAISVVAVYAALRALVG